MTFPRIRFHAARAGFAVGLALAAALLGRCVLTRAVPARLDLADFFWPLKSYTAARWISGGAPLWNPLSGCGEPWLAQLQTGVFYPGDLPFFLGAQWGPLAAIALHLAIAAAGMAAWTWDLGCSRSAALLSAIVYSGGGAFLSLVPVYNNACSAAYVPWIFLGARRLVRGGTVVTLATSSALAFLAGEPGIALAAVAAGALAALVTRREGEPGPVVRVSLGAARLAGAIALAIGLTAVALLPFAELVARTGRLSSITAEESVSRSIGASELADLMLPQSPESGAAYRPGRGGYLLSLALGPAPLLLACGCAAGFPGRRRLLLVLLLLGAGGTLLALGGPARLAPMLYDAGILRMRFPARWFVFGHLFVALAAGAGLDGWLHGRFRDERTDPDVRDGAAAQEGPRYSAAPALWSAIAGLALIGVLTALALDDLGARTGPRLVVASLSGALVAAGIALARVRESATLAPWLALAAVLPLPFVASDPLASAPTAGVSGRPRVLGSSRPEAAGRVFVPLHVPEVLTRWLELQGPAWTARTATRSREALAGYANLTCGVATPTSPSPIGNPLLARFFGAALHGGNAARALALADTSELVGPFPTSIPGARLARRVDGISLYELPGRAGRVFFARAVEQAGDDAAASAFGRADFDPEARAYVADSSVPIPSAAAGPAYAVARVETDSPEALRISVTTSTPRFLVVTRAWDRGWRASIDGAPARLARTDIAFMGLAVPAGAHRVDLRYRPLSFRIGAIVSGIACLVLLAAWLAGGPPV